jgi:hypothetical protein
MFVERMLRKFLNGSHVWRKAQTFLTATEKKQVASASFVVGAETANVINVGIQLKARDGTDVAYRAGMSFYLSSDANGDTIESSGVDSWAIGTDGILIPDGGDSLVSGVVISEVDGDIDIDMTHAGADTFYLNLLVDGEVYTSAVITFDATT